VRGKEKGIVACFFVPPHPVSASPRPASPTKGEASFSFGETVPLTETSLIFGAGSTSGIGNFASVRAEPKRLVLFGTTRMRRRCGFAGAKPQEGGQGS